MMHEILLALGCPIESTTARQPPHYVSQEIIGNIGGMQNLGQPERAIKWASEAPSTIVVIGQSINVAFCTIRVYHLFP